MDATVAIPQILLVLRLNFREVPLQPLRKVDRQHCHSIFSPFCVADRDLGVSEIDILHPQANAFHQAQTAAVE